MVFIRENHYEPCIATTGSAAGVDGAADHRREASSGRLGTGDPRGARHDDGAARTAHGRIAAARVGVRAGRSQWELHASQSGASGRGAWLPVRLRLLPTTPLTERIDQRAEKLALEQIAQVEQTMMLEDQFVYGSEHRDMLKRLVDALMARPARLWSDDERDAAS